MNKKNIKFTIAVDGGSASGKTTGSKLIAKKFNFKLLSSGKLYRYLAYRIISNKKKYNKKFILNISKKISLRKLIFKKLPKILTTKNTYQMGLGLMKKTSEKGIIRLVKAAAGVKQ